MGTSLKREDVYAPEVDGKRDQGVVQEGLGTSPGVSLFYREVPGGVWVSGSRFRVPLTSARIGLAQGALATRGQAGCSRVVVHLDTRVHARFPCSVEAARRKSYALRSLERLSLRFNSVG